MTLPAELLTILSYLASQAGAGWAASQMFDRLREAFPPPRHRPRNQVKAFAYGLLHKPRYALYTSTGLSLLIGGAAAATVAYVQGDSPAQAAWGFAAALASQYWNRHARLAGDVPQWREEA